MSYAVSGALQSAIYQHLLADSGVVAALGAAVYDEVPPGPVPDLYASLGPEEARDRSDKDGAAALHMFIISLVDNGAGFARVKAAAGAVSDALVDADLALSRGSLVSLHFARARARRTQTGDVRRIDLTFHARVQDH